MLLFKEKIGIRVKNLKIVINNIANIISLSILTFLLFIEIFFLQ